MGNLRAIMSRIGNFLLGLIWSETLNIAADPEIFPATMPDPNVFVRQPAEPSLSRVADPNPVGTEINAAILSESQRRNKPWDTQG